MNLSSVLELPAMIVPDQLALVEHGGGRWTYAALRERAARVGATLVGLGIGAGDRVGVLATNSADAVAACFGAADAGAVVVPMNYRAGVDELTHLLSDSGARVLLAEPRYAELVASARPASLEHVLLLGDELDAALAGVEPLPMGAIVDDDDTAVLLYTSGTTSAPKGVPLHHGQLTRYVMEANDAADGRDLGRMLLAAPLYHVAGLTSMLHSVWSGRVTVTIPQFSVDDWLEAAREDEVTHAFLVPTMLAKLLEGGRLADADLPSLRSVTYGAAPMPPAVIERAIEALPGVEFAGAYGQTETTSTVAVLGPDDHRLDGSPEEVALKRERLRSVGRIVDGVELRVVDDAGAPLGPDEVGEVQLRTYRAMEGYWGPDARTRVSVDDEGWVHTGDLGRVDADGYLFLVGRRGDMIIRGGENVAPEEVEAVLHELPGVLDVGVVGVADEEWGERIRATVVLADGVTVDDLAEHARARLAAFKRPADYVVVDELPRTSTGKLLRRRLVTEPSGS